MTNEQLLNEIREANMTYLMLAQNLIRQDKPEALFRLGMSEESADLISALSPAQADGQLPENLQGHDSRLATLLYKLDQALGHDGRLL